MVLDPLDGTSHPHTWTLGPRVQFRDNSFCLGSGKFYTAYSFTNGLAQIDVEHLSGSATKGYGLCFRVARRGGASKLSGYWLLIAAAGGWRLAKYDGQKQEGITPWATSKAIRTASGSRNTIAVLCHEDLIDVFINNQFVGEAEDGTYVDGGGVGPLCTSDQLEVSFRNLGIDPNR